MNTRTTIRSPGAICLGVFFAAVTACTLFADVFGGAPLTTGHILTLAGLVGAIASGHFAWPAIRNGAVIPGLLLVVVALASTAYIVVSSGARNAEQAGNKIEAIKAGNSVREREEAQLSRAQAMLAEAQDKMTRECASGKGTRCRGVMATVDVYEAAIKGHLATLAALPAPKAVNGYAHAARVLASWGMKLSSDWLELNMPFVIVLICELGTVAFLHLGFGHVRRPVQVVRQVAPVQAITERDFATDPITEAEIDELKKILGLKGCNNKTLAARLGCSPGQASKLVTAAVQAGRLSRTKEGREVRISTLH